MRLNSGSRRQRVTTSSELQYIDLKIGAGATAQAGHTVSVHRAISFMPHSFLKWNCSGCDPSTVP
jgi:hypothetical protein